MENIARRTEENAIRHRLIILAFLSGNIKGSAVANRKPKTGTANKDSSSLSNYY